MWIPNQLSIFNQFVSKKLTCSVQIRQSDGTKSVNLCNDYWTLLSSPKCLSSTNILVHRIEFFFNIGCVFVTTGAVVLCILQLRGCFHFFLLYQGLFMALTEAFRFSIWFCPTFICGQYCVHIHNFIMMCMLAVIIWSLNLSLTMKIYNHANTTLN